MAMAISSVGNGYPTHEVSPDVRAEVLQAKASPAQRTENVPLEAAVQDLDNSARQLEQVSLAFDKKLRFEVNHDLDRVIVKVIDPETDKVIKELPPEELQRLQARIQEMIGLLFDERI